MPNHLLVESKLTTGTVVTMPKRELDVLINQAPDTAGVVAVLPWVGRRRIDGRWLIVGAEHFKDAATRSVEDLERIVRSQPGLAGVQSHVDTMWVPFLAQFRDVALEGHTRLQAVLEERHNAGGESEFLSLDDTLDFEHRQSIALILAHHGAMVAGQIFQDLLAYLLALAGYRSVTINPVGVPDVRLGDLVGTG